MMNENDLQKIVDTVTERLRADFDLVPRSKPVKPEPERLPFHCPICGQNGLLTIREAEQHQRACSAPSTLEQAITTAAMKHAADFRPSANDKSHYKLCQVCRREFLSVESFNGHACAVAGRVTPIVLPDRSKPGQSERTAAAMRAERKKAILAEATEILNSKNKSEVKA